MSLFEVAPMQIGLIGTHSVGKTTLAEAIAKRFPLPFAQSDRAREIAHILLPGARLDELSEEAQWKLQQLFLHYSEEITDRTGSFITDCCGLTCDPYAHALLRAPAQTYSEFAQFLERARASTKRLSHLFYLPTEIDLIDDGFRPKSPALRDSIDEQIRTCLEPYPFFILTGSVKRRVEQFGEITNLSSHTPSMWQNYIALEGLPSSGKSTQLQAHTEWLKAQKRPVHICERFGSATLKTEIEHLYSDPVKNRDRLRALHIESFLEQFARNQVISRLEAGELVITDRQKFSVIAMHHALGTDLSTLYRDTRHLPTPGTVLYFSCSPNVSVFRSMHAEKPNHLKQDVAFQTKVARTYDWLSDHHAEFRRIPAHLPKAHVGRIFREQFAPKDTFAHATTDILAIFEQYLTQGTKPWNASVASRDLSYQTGTLSKILLQLDGYVHDHGLTREELLSQAELDIGDILSLTLFIAHKLGIDPDHAFQRQLGSDLQKIHERTRNLS